MASQEKQSRASKVPSRAASLQRMLEIERKQKMERMQLQNNRNLSPAPGRRGVSPASQNSSSSSSRASGLLHRRRDSSQTRSESEDRRMSTVRNFTLPPLSIHTQPKQRISLLPDKPIAKLSEPKMPPQFEARTPEARTSEARTPDRDALPSMVKAATAHESSNLKMVSFAAEEGTESESSSICHSPTWDDYGKKKRKEADTKRRRLTKEPPPAAMDHRPGMNPRAMTDPTLVSQQLRNRLDSDSPSQQSSSAEIASTEVTLPLPVETVETVARSPAFIGGVRLERERQNAKKRMMNSRGSSLERPVSEMMLQSPPQSQTKTDLAKKRETAPAISYPPTSSKSPFSREPRPVGSRRNSLGQGIKIAAVKLFSSKDKDTKNGQPYERNESRASVETVQTLYGSSQDRGRQMSGSTVTYSRGQSYDSHERYTDQKDERRGAVSLPPVSWKNKQKKPRTTSMMAAPPDSARDGSFSPFHSPKVKEDGFNFPFSPPTASAMSPPAGLSPSLKAKKSPTVPPTSTASPAWQPSPKKTFRQTLKAGFRSRSSTLDDIPARRRSGTLDTLVGTDSEVPSLTSDSPARQSHPAAAANGSPALTTRGARRSEEQQHTGQASSGPESKDSGASSSSSHPDSESQAPSPMTTPEGSRPQSSKDNQGFRLEEVKKIPPLSYENVIAMRGSPTLPPAGYSVPKNAASPRSSVEQSKGSPKDLVARQHGRSGSSFLEDLPPSKSFLTDELWSQSRKPLDPDQLSFTSALTSIDVKRSFGDLDSALQSPNGDVTPLSLEPSSKGATTPRGVTSQTSGFQFDLSSKSSRTSLPPSSPHATLSPRLNGRPTQGQGILPTTGGDKRSFSSQARMDSPRLPMQPNRKASDYLQEARKAAPASPRAPLGKPSSQASLSATNNAILSPRAFALNKTQSPTTPSPAAMSSPLSSQPVKRSSVQEPTPLGTPISKMLVECCHCNFYQDMPSRVYEAMARPDDVVKDKILGVSGQVTTCVKCPWCAHNMSTTCCAGYAAIVYLQEKLHGP